MAKYKSWAKWSIRGHLTQNGTLPKTLWHKWCWKCTLIKNCLAMEEMQFMQTLTAIEQESCRSVKGHFDTLSNNSKPQYNETILSLQFYKLITLRQIHWKIDGLKKKKVIKCNYKDTERSVKEQFIGTSMTRL